MIYTLTPHPALDVTYLVSNTSNSVPNTVLDKTVDPAGKGINVSKVITSLGGMSLAVSVSGNDTKNTFKTLLKQQKVPYYFFEVDQDIRTNIKIIHQTTKKVMEFNEDGPPLTSNTLIEIFNYFDERLMKDDILVLSGSIPKKTNQNLYKKVISRYKKQDITILLDTSSKALEEGIKAGPTIIKPNSSELELLVKKPLRTTKEIIDAAIPLLTYGIKEIIISRGSEGALYISNDSIYEITVPSVEVVSTVGAGDAFVGGYLYAYDKFMPIKQRLKYATAVALSSIKQFGTNPGNNQDILNLKDNINVKSHNTMFSDK